MKQENETFNCLKTTMAGNAESAVLKKAYVSPTTVYTRVLMEMDVLVTSVIDTTGKISAGKSIDGGVEFDQSGFSSSDYGSVDW